MFSFLESRLAFDATLVDVDTVDYVTEAPLTSIQVKLSADNKVVSDDGAEHAAATSEQAARINSFGIRQFLLIRGKQGHESLYFWNNGRWESLYHLHNPDMA